VFDERIFIARVESANTDELVRLLIAPTAQEEKAFRAYFGDELYQRLHLMALKSSFRRGERDAKGNVVVIHGIMGSELTAINRAGAGEQLWLKVLRIINGKLDLLRLGDEGRTEYNPDYDIRASGILKRYYGKLLLSLSESWNVRAFWFDWRKDLKLAADELQAQISGWFGDDAPVHIVAHSMGGLVARTFIKKHPQRWEAMWDKQSNGKAGGRLIMLGTPNHGSFDIPQVITGLQETVRKLNLIDIRHRLTDLQTILNSFVGSYQMLPSPFVMESMEPLYKSETYADLQVPQRHLDNAWQHHKWLSDVAWS
jgi:pimeloyl-ACP methyl ester carboxylesterase